MVLPLDLNSLPPPDDAGSSIDLSLNIGLPWERGMLQIQVTTRIESVVDDDVVICSPRGFVEAREKARRNRQVMEMIGACNDFQRGSSGSTARLFHSSNNQHGGSLPIDTIVNSGQFINLESNLNSKDKDVAIAPKISQIVPPPKVPVFSCPVCISPIVEETSTKCGHIYCKRCIETAIASQGKCPTCRRKLKVKDTFRIYLPASD